MGERETTAVTEEPAEEFFEPGMSELAAEDFESLDLPRRSPKKR